MASKHKVTLVDILSNRYTPIQDAMISVLPVQDLLRLVSTCRGFSDLKSTAWSLDRQLFRFFKDPLEFRRLQARSNALISGMDFFEFFTVSRTWKEIMGGSGLVIVAEETEALKQFLLNDGYYLDPVNMRLPFSTGCQYFKVSSGRAPACVLLIASNGPPIRVLLHFARTTSDMAFASWNKAYMLFPEITIINKDVYLVGDISGPTGQYLSILSDMGYKTKDIDWNWKYRNLSSASRSLVRDRQIRDKYTWIVALSTDGIEGPRVADDVLEVTGFSLDKVRARSTGANATVAHYKVTEQTLLSYPILKHQYLLSPSPERASDMRFLKARLDNQTRVELMKIPTEERTPLAQAVLHGLVAPGSIRYSFVPPPSWTFYDDDLVTYIQKSHDLDARNM